MMTNCSHACGLCKSICIDRDVHCSAWAKAGAISPWPHLPTALPQSAIMMMRAPSRQCLHLRVCPPAGHCETNPFAMLKACPSSCGICHHVERDEQGKVRSHARHVTLATLSTVRAGVAGALELSRRALRFQ
jgi:hypothetical protein